MDLRECETESNELCVHRPTCSPRFQSALFSSSTRDSDSSNNVDSNMPKHYSDRRLEVDQNPANIDRPDHIGPVPAPSGNGILQQSKSGRGRPQKSINWGQVKHFRKLGFNWKKISNIMKIPWATLKRRRKEEVKIREHIGYSKITDGELDTIVNSIIQKSPNSGERMIMGALRSRNLRIERRRVRESINRVDSKGKAERSKQRRIYRRVYHVPYPNALW